MAVKVTVYGEAKLEQIERAQKELEKLRKAAGGTGQGFSKMGVAIGTAMGTLAAKGIEVAAAKAYQFGKDAVNSFRDAGKEALTLQRYMGGTAEDASRLASAAKVTGVPVDALSRGMGFLSKNAFSASSQFAEFQQKQQAAAAANKTFTGKLGAQATMFKQLGIQITDASGHTRASKDILLDFADQFSKLPPGVDRTALAMKAFGRGGMQLMPFLARGREGLQDLFNESDKLGTTMSGKDLQAVKDYGIAQRTMQEAIKGASMSIGRVLLPFLTQLAIGFTALAEHARPFIEAISRGLERVLSVAKDLVVRALQPLGAAFQTLKGYFSGSAAGAVQVAGMMGRLRDVVADLRVWWQDRLAPALQLVAGYFQTRVAPIIERIATQVAPALISGVQRIGFALVAAVRSALPYWQRLGAQAVTIAKFFVERVLPAVGPILKNTISVLSGVISGLVRTVGKLIGAMQPLTPIIWAIVGAMAAWKIGSLIVDTIKFVAALVQQTIALGSQAVAWVTATAAKVADTAANIANTASTVAGNIANAARTAGLWAYNAVMLVIKGATIAWTGVQWALNVALNANPIGLIVIAIAALVGGIILAYKHSDTFRKIVTAAFNGAHAVISAVWNWVKTHWPLLLGILTGPIGIAVLLIVRNWKKISDGAKQAVGWVKDHLGDMLNFVKSLPGKVASGVSGIWNSLSSGIRGVINTIIDAWNSIDFGVHIHLPKWAGGFGLDINDIIPDIPRLARGGVVNSPTLALVGEAGPEAIVPLSRERGLGTSITVQPGAIVLNIGGDMAAGDRLSLEATVQKSIEDSLTKLAKELRAS